MKNKKEYINFNYDNLKIGSLSFDDLTSHNTLFYIRIRGKKHHFNLFYNNTIVKKLKNISSFKTISEYKKDADHHINLNNKNLTHLSENDHAIIKKSIKPEEVIFRCRGLRNISTVQATSHINICAKYFINFFQKNKEIKVIIMNPIDNYVMDIMYRIGTHFNIQFIGICYFVNKNYRRATIYGEHNTIREPKENEIEELKKYFYMKQKSFMAVSIKTALKASIRDFASYIFRYVIRFIIKYKLFKQFSFENRFLKYFPGCKSVEQFLGFLYFDKVNLKKINQKTVLINLHFHPEASVDYWCEDFRDSNYIESLLKVIEFLSNKNYIILLKEHPLFFLRRHLIFYKRIKKNKNVKLLSPFISTQKIINFADKIVVWSGSIGLEALPFKPVFTVYENYYSTKLLPHYTEIDNFETPLDEETITKIYKNVLKNTIPCA